MAKIDRVYHKLVTKILSKGRWYDDPEREGVRRIQIPSHTFKWNFKDGFPAITTKNIYWKAVVGELLWFLRGDTDIYPLVKEGINIWNKDAYNYYLKQDFIFPYETIEEYIENIGPKDETTSDGLDYDLGRIYGAQWRSWTMPQDKKSAYFARLDQIAILIKNLKEKPLSTQHIVTAWNPAEVNDMALPPCHWSFQINVWKLSPIEIVENAKKMGLWQQMEQPMDMSLEVLDQHREIQSKFPKYGFELVWNQRSVDTFLGLPFNIASYALLAHIIGKMVNMVPIRIKGNLNNVHLYDNSIDKVAKQLSNNSYKYGSPNLVMSSYSDENWMNYGIDIIEQLEINDFILENYESYPAIKAEMLTRD